MNNLSNKKARRILPFVIEFVKFSAAFLVLIAFALVTLHAAIAAQ
jgi:hypothetical protein